MRGLIEVLIGLGIWSVLVALAASFYRVYVERAYVVEALIFATTIRQEILAEYAFLGRWPERISQHAPGSEAVRRSLRSIDYSDGAFTLRLSRPAGVHAIDFRPALGPPGAPVVWLCGYAAPPPGYASAAPNRSDIPPRYLPGACRSRA